MIEINALQGSEAWHQARAKCFNASEAPAMMGVSKYMTRSDLLKQKATGIIPEVDAATQARFDMGHMVEAMARQLAEAIIGEELYPMVATDDAGVLLASSDGATMLCNIGFEHKLWNKEIAALVASGKVPDSHVWQLDQQCAVFGFDRIMFVCSDGTPENFVYCWYSTTPERVAQLRAGWDQFKIDLANYQHIETIAAPVAESIEELPALSVSLVGQVTSSNLATFKDTVLARIQAINTTLVTDADFVNADKMVKFLDDGEKRLELVKSQALSQTATIDELFRTIDGLKAEMRSKRLTLDKLVKSEKESRKAEIILNARQELAKHVEMQQKRVGVSFDCSQFGGIFADAIKGLKSLDSMRDKASVALANAKIESSAIAYRIEMNQKLMMSQSAIHLFPDWQSVCTKAADDFESLLAARIAQRKEAEEKRLAAEREKIRIEEEAKAQAAARREAQEAAAKAEAERLANDQLSARNMTLYEVAILAGKDIANHIEQPLVMVDAPVIKESLTTGNTVKLGEICARLGFTVTADFLASLGFEVVATDKNAKLYREDSFKHICAGISAHVLNIGSKPLKLAA